jgi:hypothetical protein
MNILVSAELFDDVRINTTTLHDLLTSPQHPLHVHIVLSHRQLYDWLNSYHNQYFKRGKADSTFVQWLTSGNTLHQMLNIYTSKVYERYNALPDFKVSVINMHNIRENETQLSHFFCHHVDNAINSCQKASQNFVEKKVNPSNDHDRTLFMEAIVKKYPSIIIDADPQIKKSINV